MYDNTYAGCDTTGMYYYTYSGYDAAGMGNDTYSSYETSVEYNNNNAYNMPEAAEMDFREQTDGYIHAGSLKGDLYNREKKMPEKEETDGTDAILGGVEPIDVNVNISGVKELKVCFYSGNPSWFGSSIFIFCFVNPTLHKNYVAPKK